MIYLKKTLPEGDARICLKNQTPKPKNNWFLNIALELALVLRVWEIEVSSTFKDAQSPEEICIRKAQCFKRRIFFLRRIIGLNHFPDISMSTQCPRGPSGSEAQRPRAPVSLVSLIYFLRARKKSYMLLPWWKTNLLPRLLRAHVWPTPQLGAHA